MNNLKVILAATATLLVISAVPSAFATDCRGSEPCDIVINDTTHTYTKNTTINTVTTNFSKDSAEAGLRLQSVYDVTGTFAQKNTGTITATGNHDVLMTNNAGNVQVDVSAIANNVSANLVGMGNINLSIAQHNSGNVTATNDVRHPYVSGNMEISTTAIGNNASVNWDLTTDKAPGSDNFATKKDGRLRSFDSVGTSLGSIAQCNTGSILAQTSYSQDPAANIKVNTTAIGNNISFGTKTR